MTARRAWLEAAVVCAALGIGVPLACQPFPVLRVPTHEFTQLFTLLAFLVLPFLARRIGRLLRARRPEARDRELLESSLLAGTAAAFACGALAFGVMAVANALGPRCRLVDAALFFWVTYPPAAILAVVIGAACVRCSLRAPVLMLAAVVGLSLAQDAAQALSGVRAADLILGEPLALNQRVDAAPPLFHVLQRAFVMLLAGAAAAGAAWAAARRDVAAGNGPVHAVRAARARALLLGAAAAAAALFGGSHIGVGWGKAALHAQLPRELRTQHFIIRHPATGEAAARADAVARHAEWCHAYLRALWGIDPVKPVEIYVFNGHREMEQATGMGAHAVVRKVFVDAHQARHSVLLHELVHALHVELKPKWTVILNRGAVEGLAEAVEALYADAPEAHRREAGALAADKLPSAAVFMHPLGFWRMNETNAYYASASFMGFLMRAHGPEKFQTYQRTLDFQRAFGKDLGGLDADWRAFLRTVPLDSQSKVRGATGYDPAFFGQGYAQCDCPKLGDAVPGQEDAAQTLVGAGQFAEAAPLYRELHEKDGALKSFMMLTLSLSRGGRAEEAAALLRERLDRPDLPEAERAMLLDRQRDVLMRLRAWDALDPVLDTLVAREEEPNARADRETLRDCLRDPALRDAAAGALLEDDFCRRRILLETLRRAHPDNAAVRRLWLLRGFSLDYAGPVEERVARVRDALALFAADPADRRILAPHLSDVLGRLLDDRQYAAAREVCAALRSGAEDPVERAKLARFTSRLDFEESPEGAAAAAGR